MRLYHCHAVPLKGSKTHCMRLGDRSGKEVAFFNDAG